MNTPQGPAGEPEYVGSSPAEAPTSADVGGKRWGVLAGAAVGVAAVVGLGGWGAFALLSGGSQPADAIPADAVGYLSVDLDPSASQKIEAIRILKKFPGIEKELDIGDRDDLRRYVFERMQAEGECKNLDYRSDIEPWIGDRLAVAAVPGAKDKIAPLVVLQVSGEDAAAAGIKALAECGEAKNSQYGFAFSENYVLLTESTQLAESFAAEAERSSLAEDDQFLQWTEAVGDPGILTMYASAEAPESLMHALMTFEDRLADPTIVSSEGAVSDGPLSADFDTASGQMNQQMSELLKDFEGMAAVVRFEDGAIELESASRGADMWFPQAQDGAATGVTTLPASTGAVVSVAFSDGWLQKSLDEMSALTGDDASMDEGLAQMEKETGLSLPEDIETLLGDSVAVVVDSEINFEVLAQSEDGSGVPAGIKVDGDPAEIMPIVDKLRARLGPQADELVVEEGENTVAFGLDEDYVSRLLEEGGLGSEESFGRVVPDGDRASGVLYLNFDANDGWVERLVQSITKASGATGPSEAEALENLEPLDAFGISSWSEDSDRHSLVRLTTD